MVGVVEVVVVVVGGSLVVSDRIHCCHCQTPRHVVLPQHHLAGDDHGQESAVELVVVVAAAVEVMVGDPGLIFRHHRMGLDWVRSRCR